MRRVKDIKGIQLMDMKMGKGIQHMWHKKN